MPNLITPAQLSFVDKLIAERATIYRQLGQDSSAAVILTYTSTHDVAGLSKAKASTGISALIAGNKELREQANNALRAVAAAPQTTGRITEDGMYRMDGTIYKVQEARNGSGRLYAKVLADNGDNTFSFEYAAGIVYKLRAEHKLTLDEAKEFGALYGTCCVCSRTLTNENSIEAGIGPICASKF